MILKIRGVLFVFVLSFSMMLYWPFAVLGGIFLDERGAYYIATLWGRWINKVLKYLLGITYRVIGAENIPDKPCVVLSKHQAALDIFVLLRVFHPQAWVLKRELMWMPFFGWALWSTRPIAINRGAGRQAIQSMVDQGIKKLKKGFWILLYPEGTRVPPGQKKTYKIGGAILAQKAGVDIVPVALNTGLFWQKGKGVINNGVVDIVVGKPISVADKDPKDVMDEVEASIEENALAITAEHPYYLQLKAEETH